MPDRYTHSIYIHINMYFFKVCMIFVHNSCYMFPDVCLQVAPHVQNLNILQSLPLITAINEWLWRANHWWPCNQLRFLKLQWQFGPLPSQSPPSHYSSKLNQIRCTTKQIPQIIHAQGPIRELEREWLGAHGSCSLWIDSETAKHVPLYKSALRIDNFNASY